MKTGEITKIANIVIDAYEDSGKNLYRLTEVLDDIYVTNEDIYIQVDSVDGSVQIAPSYKDHISLYRYKYNLQMQTLLTKLKESPLNKVATISEDTNPLTGEKTKTLGYACYLSSPSVLLPDSSGSSELVMYIFSPLYPVKSTVSILRVQLIYITIIATLLALALALYLARRISRPIKNITHSAAEMGKGHYGIKFQGGHYSEITDLANTLTNASRELEKTDMYQKDLIANVSHDLRTPLTMIKSYAEMIRDLSGNNPKKRDAHLAVIIDETDRLNILVNDMLNLSRMQNRTIPLERTNFDLKATAESLLASYDLLADRKSVV